MDISVFSDHADAMIAIELQLEEVDEILANLRADAGAQKARLEAQRRMLEVQLRTVKDLMAVENGVSIRRTMTDASNTSLNNDETLLPKENEPPIDLAGLSITENLANGDDCDTNSEGISFYESVLDEVQNHLIKMICLDCHRKWSGNKCRKMCPHCGSDFTDIAAKDNDASLNHNSTSDETASSFDIKGKGKAKALDPDPEITCSACNQNAPIQNTLTLPCSHVYCHACILDWFEMAIRQDISIFPPRCCYEDIAPEHCTNCIPKELMDDYERRKEEKKATDPTYCSNPGCTRFICANDISANVGTCAHCGKTTCTTCKNKEHNGLCPDDPHVKALHVKARREKWQQCSKCKNMIELTQGCFHMTCSCSHEFCYICGKKWKTCKCPQWNEGYLTRPAPARPAPLALGNDAAGPARNTAATTPRPRRNPCPLFHRDWERHYGGNCSECGADYLPWVMRCEYCRLVLCMRCRDPYV